MTVPVLTAVTGAPWESQLVAGLERGALGVAVVRRCVDLSDLLAAAASGRARAVLLSADLRRLDRDALSRLAVARVAVVGVIAPGDEQAERQLRQLGVGHVLAADADPADVAAAVRAAVDEDVTAPAGYSDPGAAADELATLAPSAGWAGGPDPEELEPGSGQLIAVWGPTGAPGRTTLAVTLASELAEIGRRTLLADADTYGGVVAQVLGLLDEAPGLAAATRAANNGQLDVPALARHARQVTPHLRVLTGIARADRWPELRPAALEVVWALARSLVEVTVVDCGFSLEQDEELSFDTTAPRRNAATLVTLAQADAIVAVGTADPVGMQRFVRGLTDLRELAPQARIRVVVNRLRRGPIGGEARMQIADALARYVGIDDICFVPYDRGACDRAIAQGRTLTEVAADSPARTAIAALAADLAGAPALRRRRGSIRAAGR